jgi:dTDP-4-amino-4,6-dideoxygalactose transaminase
MLAAGVGPGDIVITTPFSFVASANAALFVGAVPVFVDIDPVTMNIDAAQVAEVVDSIARRTSHAERFLPRRVPASCAGPGGPRRIAAILPVHVFGQSADMAPLLATGAEHGVPVIEDACEAVGASYQGSLVGTLGAASVFGFYPNKQLTTGEGGMFVTSNPGWAQLARSLRNQGRDNDATWLRHVRLGYNYRLDDMSAAVGLGQLRRLDSLLAARDRVAGGYCARLASVDGVRLPQLAPSTTRTSWFVFVVRLAVDIDRDEVMARLQADGIPSRPYFSPLHLQQFYREQFGYVEGDLPETEAAGACALALPFHNKLTDDDLDLIVDRLTDAIARSRRPRSRTP